MHTPPPHVTPGRQGKRGPQAGGGDEEEEDERPQKLPVLWPFLFSFSVLLALLSRWAVDTRKAAHGWTQVAFIKAGTEAEGRGGKEGEAERERERESGQGEVGGPGMDSGGFLFLYSKYLDCLIRAEVTTGRLCAELGVVRQSGRSVLNGTCSCFEWRRREGREGRRRRRRKKKE